MKAGEVRLSRGPQTRPAPSGLPTTRTDVIMTEDGPNEFVCELYRELRGTDPGLDVRVVESAGPRRLFLRVLHGRFGPYLISWDNGKSGFAWLTRPYEGHGRRPARDPHEPLPRETQACTSCFSLPPTPNPFRRNPMWSAVRKKVGGTPATSPIRIRIPTFCPWTPMDPQRRPTSCVTSPHRRPCVTEQGASMR
jgi:hypothetical protein